MYAQLDTAFVQCLDHLRRKALCEEGLLNQGLVPAKSNHVLNANHEYVVV